MLPAYPTFHPTFHLPNCFETPTKPIPTDSPQVCILLVTVCRQVAAREPFDAQWAAFSASGRLTEFQCRALRRRDDVGEGVVFSGLQDLMIDVLFFRHYGAKP